jgi:hypothetical protein
VAWAVLKVKVGVMPPIQQSVGPYARFVGLDRNCAVPYRLSSSGGVVSSTWGHAEMSSAHEMAILLVLVE